MKRILATSLAIALTAAPAAGQSLLAIPGLGVPQPPVDAVARGLGGVTLGVFGLPASIVNPAAIAGVSFRGAVAAFESSARSIEFGAAADDVGSTRFPLAHVMLPVGERFVLGLGYGGFMDQSWAVTSDRTVTIDGSDVAARDVIESRGGISQFRLNLSYELTERFAIGAGAGFYSGERDLRLSRSFADTLGLGDFTERTLRSYSGPLLAAGVRIDPAPFLRVEGALTWSGELEADETRDTIRSSRTFTMPLQLAAGASALLSRAFSVTIGGEWAGWSATGEDAGIGAEDSWRLGGGVEWSGASLLGQPMPIRLGASTGRLPFQLDGEAPSEWTASLGIGARFAGETPLARIDAALERGARSAAELSEEFWRFTLSLAVMGR